MLLHSCIFACYYVTTHSLLFQLDEERKSTYYVHSSAHADREITCVHWRFILFSAGLEER